MRAAIELAIDMAIKRHQRLESQRHAPVSQNHDRAIRSLASPRALLI
jgi:hypothetical protein